jgi:hypothetical protein
VTVTVNYAKYARVGRTIHAQVVLTASSGSAGAGLIAVDLPVAAAQDGLLVGSFVFVDASDSGRHNAALAYTGTTPTPDVVYGVLHNEAPAAGMPAQLGTGDIVRYSVTYEAAT